MPTPFKIIRKVIYYFNLESELENHEVIHEEIEKGIVFKGTNLWILAFAIIIASVGLNMNSTAVIIGAMLISPLMGPINGMGYSIATYNFPLFRKAVKNFTFAVITSLVTSSIYFAISPISTAHSELLARTSPSIYDVLIALFGGLAGIVAISTKQKGNVIPGVAIATALMPPLCTAGYGIATAQFDFFLGAIYLFTINTVFIALASVAISQYLKFPITTLVDINAKKRVNRWISIVIVIVTVPSIYFGYLLVQKERFNENASKFIESISYFEGNYLLSSKIDANKKTISLTFAGSSLSDTQKEKIKSLSQNFKLQKSSIIFNQGLTFDEIDAQKLETINLQKEVERLKQSITEKNFSIDSIKNISNIGYLLLIELKAIYPQVEQCFYAETKLFSNPDNSNGVNTPVLFIKTINGKINETEKEKIKNWAKMRLKKEEVFLIIE
ncbi:MAG: DUF389 domain-containing protein [Bacteroidia bacterium]